MAENDRPPRGAAPGSAAGPAADAREGAPFEAALERLEGIVDRLEDGDLPLEEALARFEEGVALSRQLADQLTAAEQRVERLVREGGEVSAQPVDLRALGGAEDST
jgi:exodeoxyribonuclease VII small subunit